MTSGTEMVQISTIFGYFRLFLAVAVTTVACSTTGAPTANPEEVATADESSTPPEASGHLEPEGAGLEIEVTRVSDGDSLRATSSEGELEIRLLGINAPELDDCFGDRAEVRLQELLTERTITLHPWPTEQDQFGRELGHLMANDTFVNLAMVESGHAVARSQSDHGFDAEFEAAESAASDAELGLWAPDACGEPTEAELHVVRVEENPPGDDRENPNGEWVFIENAGDTEVDLTGWSLRDESTRHRYNFPSVSLAAGGSVRIRTGCGEDDFASVPVELFWCDPEPPVWNNSGDTAFLLDPNGGVADSYDVSG